MQTIKTFLTCLMLISSATVMAQTTTVKGTVTDKTLGEGEPFATIRIYKQGKTDKAVAMFLTDKDGAFSHEVEGKGSHDLVVSSIGKADLHQTITLGEKTVLDLGTLTLSDDAKTLSGVEVVAQKP